MFVHNQNIYAACERVVFTLTAQFRILQNCACYFEVVRTCCQHFTPRHSILIVIIHLAQMFVPKLQVTLTCKTLFFRIEVTR